MKCKYCNKEIKNKGSLIAHEKSCKIINETDMNKLKNLYYVDLLTIREISQKYTDIGENKLSELIIEQKLKKYKKHKDRKTKECEYCGMKVSVGTYETHIKVHKNIIENTENILYDYIEEKISVRELSKKYKTHHSNITKCLLDNNIKMRTLSECNKILRDNFPEKWKHSKETKLLLSEIHKKNNYGTISFFRNRKTILYYIKIHNYYKIGITTRSVKERYRNEIKYKIIKEWIFDDGVDAFLLEKEILNNINDEDKYRGKNILRNGNSEIITKDYITNIENIIKNKMIYYNISFGDDKINNKIKEKIVDDILIKYDITHNIKKYCSCGKEISKRAKICEECWQLKQRKVKRPGKEILSIDVKELGYSATGRKYGVCDNTIRKWIIYYSNNVD